MSNQDLFSFTSDIPVEIAVVAVVEQSELTRLPFQPTAHYYRLLPWFPFGNKDLVCRHIASVIILLQHAKPSEPYTFLR